MAVNTFTYTIPKRRVGHMRVWIVEKSWDLPKEEYALASKRETKLIIGYNKKEDAEAHANRGNQACSKCPERTANKTRYRVLEKPIYVRMRYE